MRFVKKVIAGPLTHSKVVLLPIRELPRSFASGSLAAAAKIKCRKFQKNDIDCLVLRDERHGTKDNDVGSFGAV